ncbi:MAG TPA: HAD family phosphatase [Nocardia sp.]|uniref:HAD family hydrolase n=1 Tax=Nocardia TaxID=1817 RepID=UPI002456E42B|nr:MULTISPECIES: HAD family phosphatase [Nocardia]HLS77446.1 HAD family phosphatase [Nocardia sp.]
MTDTTTRQRRYRAVVFDWAGVLTEPPLTGLIRYNAELGLPEGVLPAFVRGDEEFAKVERGETTIKEFLKGVCVRVERTHGVRVDIRALAAAMSASRGLRPDMLALVEELGAGYELAVLTNNVAENAAHLARTLPLERFRMVLNSAELGLRKPDPAVYRELLRRLERDAAEVVYIDDFEENLPPARDLGITAIHYRDTEALRETLRGLGIG